MEPKPKVFGENGVALWEAANGMKALSEFTVPSGITLLSGPGTCAPDDPDVAFHMTLTQWDEFNVRLNDFNAAMEAVLIFAPVAAHKIGVVLEELKKLRFWNLH